MKKIQNIQKVYHQNMMKKIKKQNKKEQNLEKTEDKK